MLLSIGLAALLPYAILISVSIVFVYRTVSEDSFRYAAALSEQRATEISVKLNSLVGQGKSIASAFSAYAAIPPAERRAAIDGELRAVIEDQPDVLAAWAQWERGAIGDDPRDYVGSKLTTASGAFNTTWYRVGSDIHQGWINDDAYGSDFYTIPKASRRISLIEPYWYSYTNDEKNRFLETSLCIPIVTGGTFKGVLGFDFSVDLFERMVARPAPVDPSYGVLIAGSGIIVGHPRAERMGRPFAEGELSEERRADFLRLLSAGTAFTFDGRSSLTGEDSRYYFSPVKVEGVEVPWFFALVAPTARILAPARVIAFVLIALGAVGAFLVAASILLVSRALSRPISALAEGARRISSGELSYRVPAEGSRGTSAEVNALASSFNEMADKLQAILSELESRVVERTASLAAANGELERTLAELKTAQSGLEFSAKMALLGRLTAGISHELNTPIGVIRSSASAILRSSEDLERLFLPTYAALPEADRGLFRELFGRGLRKARSGPGTEDRRRKKEVVRRLEAAGAEKARDLAEAMSTLDAFDLERELLAFAGRGGWGAISAAEGAVESCESAAAILEAAEKAARTVSALANYSRSEGLDALEAVRPAEEIEELLTLHYNRIKRSVAVERDFACRDPVRGYRDRLVEVWMNLIDNALQAMDYKGRLRVSTAREGDWVVVSVADSGPGIPDDLREKVFTPFFTTKSPGEGIGLGLDICRRIVERHGGSMSFVSRPGETVFSVKLRAAVAEAGP
jgi:signal transduction histidine kinase